MRYEVLVHLLAVPQQPLLTALPAERADKDSAVSEINPFKGTAGQADSRLSQQLHCSRDKPALHHVSSPWQSRPFRINTVQGPNVHCCLWRACALNPCPATHWRVQLRHWRPELSCQHGPLVAGTRACTRLVKQSQSAEPAAAHARKCSPAGQEEG